MRRVVTGDQLAQMASDAAARATDSPVGLFRKMLADGDRPRVDRGRQSQNAPQRSNGRCVDCGDEPREIGERCLECHEAWLVGSEAA